MRRRNSVVSFLRNKAHIRSKFPCCASCGNAHSGTSCGPAQPNCTYYGYTRSSAYTVVDLTAIIIIPMEFSINILLHTVYFLGFVENLHITRNYTTSFLFESFRKTGCRRPSGPLRDCDCVPCCLCLCSVAKWPWPPPINSKQAV